MHPLFFIKDASGENFCSWQSAWKKIVDFPYLKKTALKYMEERSFIFWDIKPCSPLKLNRRFGGTCRLHLQGWRVSQGKNQNEPGSKLACISYCLPPLKRRLTFNGLRRITSQKTQLFITTAENLKSYMWKRILHFDSNGGKKWRRNKMSIPASLIQKRKSNIFHSCIKSTLSIN
jgi:hypothetical protein